MKPPRTSPLQSLIRPYGTPLPSRFLVWAILLAVSTASFAAAQSPYRRAVLTHGSTPTPSRAAHIWFASIRTGPEPMTLVLSHEVLGDSRWKEYPAIPARALALTQHAGELILLLQDRSWAWYSVTEQAERFSYGPQLPARAKIMALAGNDDSLYAIGQPPRPAARPESAPSTQPTTQPVAPALYRFRSATWTRLVTTWPPDAPDSLDSHPLWLEIVADQPHFAVLCPDRSIRLYRLARNAENWTLLHSLPAPEHLRFLKVLNLKGLPAIWIQTDRGVGTLVADGRSTPLAPPQPSPTPDEMDLTVAGHQLRLLFRQNSNFHEQRYTLSGLPDGAPTQLVAISKRGDAPATWVVMTVMMVLAVFMVVSFLRRRPAPTDEDRPEDPDR